MADIRIVRGDEEFVFEDILGHQIGNGAVQVLMMDGDQRVINGYTDVFYTLSEEEKADYAFKIAQAEAEAAAMQAQRAVVDPAGYEDADEEDDGSDEPTVQ